MSKYRILRSISFLYNTIILKGGVLATLRKSFNILRNEGVNGVSKRIKYLYKIHNLVRTRTPPPPLDFRTSLSNGSPGPLVSVIIPVFDRTDLLREAVNSVLRQTYQNFELIIVSDGSPHATLDVLSEYEGHEKVKIFNFPTQSGTAVKGRNKGLLEARGKYVAFLDSDDVAENSRLELSIPPLENDVADVVYGSWKAIIDGSRALENLLDGQVVESPDCSYEELLDSCVPCQSTVTIRRSLALRFGYLKTQFRYREDHEFWVRLAFYGARFSSVNNVLAGLRIHVGNNELNFKGKSTKDEWFEKILAEHKIVGPKPKKIALLVPGLGIGGGMIVIFKHAEMLIKAGHDVTIINCGMDDEVNWYGDLEASIVHIDDTRTYIFDNIDILFATGWQTAEHLDDFRAKRKVYFVQSDERRFASDQSTITHIHDTYLRQCEYITEAKWIQKWLNEEFGHDAQYVPNGLDFESFYPDVQPVCPRSPTRLRVLIEGPVDVPFKGVTDAYEAVTGLDCDIWLVSSAGRPLPEWKIDRFFERVAFTDMPAIYASCDVFIKMSRVEGFFGPPLEAMACGCAVVVGEVTGRDEYIVDGHNGIVVAQRDIQAARRSVQALSKDQTLRQKLVKNGLKTVRNWSWDRSGQMMLDVVDQRAKELN